MNFGYFLDQKVWIQCSRLGHYSGWDIIQDWDIIQIITIGLLNDNRCQFTTWAFLDYKTLPVFFFNWKSNQIMEGEV